MKWYKILEKSFLSTKLPITALPKEFSFAEVVYTWARTFWETDAPLFCETNLVSELIGNIRRATWPTSVALKRGPVFLPHSLGLQSAQTWPLWVVSFILLIIQWCLLFFFFHKMSISSSLQNGTTGSYCNVTRFFSLSKISEAYFHILNIPLQWYFSGYTECVPLYKL